MWIGPLGSLGKGGKAWLALLATFLIIHIFFLSCIIKKNQTCDLSQRNSYLEKNVGDVSATYLSSLSF